MKIKALLLVFVLFFLASCNSIRGPEISVNEFPLSVSTKEIVVLGHTSPNCVVWCLINMPNTEKILALFNLQGKDKAITNSTGFFYKIVEINRGTNTITIIAYNQKLKTRSWKTIEVFRGKDIYTDMKKDQVLFQGNVLETSYPIYIKNERSMICSDDLARIFGLDVRYDILGQEILISNKKMRFLKMILGKNNFYTREPGQGLNDTLRLLDASAEINCNQVFVPFRAVVEFFGSSIYWEANRKLSIVE